MDFIDFNRPSIVGNELEYIKDAIYEKKALCGNGYYTSKCNKFIEDNFAAKKSLLTTSCTSALEMCSLLLDLKEGDEVIVPSYTFVSTVNAFVLRGAIPRFVDIREDTLNINENLIEAEITDNTKAIYIVHYAGVGAEMEKINEIAGKYNLFVVEDAAQGVDAKYKGKYLGTLGHLGAFSFHETKNYICGEGGALIINKEDFFERAEIILEKGTNRKQFTEGIVDKYTWVDIGSSYVLSELNAAYLYGQLENKDRIFKKRRNIFNRYNEGLKMLEEQKKIKLPVIPDYCDHNSHMFYIICNTEKERNNLIKYLKENNIQSVFHYIPLHKSKMGYTLVGDVSLPVTEDISKRVLRLPFFYDLDSEMQNFVITAILDYFK